MKRLYVFILIIIVMLFVLQWCFAIETDFSPENIQKWITEAKTYTSIKDFPAPTYYSSNVPDYIMIATVKKILMYNAWKEWQKFRELSQNDITQIIEDPVLGIIITTYGNKTNFASDVNVVLIQDQQVIQPYYIDNPKLPDITEKYGYDFEKTIVAMFRYSDFNPMKNTTIIYVKDNVRIPYEVNFSDIE